MSNRPNVLTIAGFDPSGGAGLTSDVKTLENIQCYGLAICSANTVQNDIQLAACHWTPLEIMKAQMKLLFNRFEIQFVKIGIVENWETLIQITDCLIEQNPSIKIILDPVLKASSNFEFHTPEHELFTEVLKNVFLITPNIPEFETLFPGNSLNKKIQSIRKTTNLFLKGGHSSNAIGVDELFMSNGSHCTYRPSDLNISEKHGSGCVLSSAITGYLAQGHQIKEACSLGKEYVEKYLSSNPSLLGYHHA